MYFSYTSKRRHRPDILGPELAPSMVFTNWTAGNSATLSNDASGNLKVSYNAVANPYAYRAITVAVNSVYRIKVNSVSDGTAQLPVVSIGTTPGGNQLGEFDFRKTAVTDASGSVDILVFAPATTIYLSLYCALAAAGYAAFSGASARIATTITHAASDVVYDGLAFSAGAYTPQNSTITSLNVFGIAYGKEDNAISILNSGAVAGDARRTYAFPTISGRIYRAKTAWLPHSITVSEAYLGSSLGGNQHGAAARYADIDHVKSFFIPGTGLRWNFAASIDSWTLSAFTANTNPTTIELTSSSTSPAFQRAGLSFSGYKNRYVAIRLRRTSAAGVDQVTLNYSTPSHGYSGSYEAAHQQAQTVQNVDTIFVWDMWQLSTGGNDWKDSTITGLSIGITQTNAAIYQVDWIAVGNLNPIEHTFTATGSSAFLTLHNSADNNAISYYVAPQVTQLDSTYTLSQTDVNTLDPVDEYIVNETRTIAGVSYGLYDRTDEGWSIVSYKIQDADKADWDEFFASCCALETFRFDPYATTDTTTTKTCELVPGSQKLTRIDDTSMWRAQFKVRVAV